MTMLHARRSVLAAVVGLAIAAGFIGSAAADAMMLHGDEIRATVSDTTISGTMLPDTAYTEYYGADGTIKGTSPDGPYTGMWSVDGDMMCFDYGDPATVSCWGVALEGDMVHWMDKDGNKGGTGTVVKGNPNNL